MTYELAIEALADPTRRGLFERLRRGPQTVGELAELGSLRQPTVSQHLQVLRGARLVTDRRDGTRRYYSASREGLAGLRSYVEGLRDGVLAGYGGTDVETGAGKPPARRGARKPRRKGAR